MRSLIIGILTISAFTAKAEEIKIKSFSLQMEPMTVPMQRTDANGEICALVKVIIPSARAAFEGSLIGNCEYKTSEYWCYLKPGSKQLRIKYPNCEPLMVNFEKLIGSGLKSKQIYELTLVVPESSVRDTFTIHGEINLKPLDKTKIMIWGETQFPKGLRVCHISQEGEHVAMLDSKALGLVNEDGTFIGLSGVSVLGTISNPMMKLSIPFSFSNVRIGDTFTVMCDDADYPSASIIVSNERIGKGQYDINFIQKPTPLSAYMVDKITNEPLRNISLKLVRGKSNKVFHTVTDDDGYFKISDAYNDESYTIYYGDSKNDNLIPAFFHSGQISNRVIPVIRGQRIDRLGYEWKVVTDDGNTPESHRFGSLFNPETWISYPENDSMKGMTFTRQGYPTIHINGFYPGRIGIYAYPKGKSKTVYEYNSDGTITSHKKQK